MQSDRLNELKELVKSGLYFDDHTYIFTAVREISKQDRDDLLALIEAEQSRQSVTDAEVQRAIEVTETKIKLLGKAIGYPSHDNRSRINDHESTVEEIKENLKLEKTVLAALSAYRKPSADAVCDEILWQEIFSLREKIKIAVEAIKSYDSKFDDKLFLHQLNSADYDQLMEELSGNGQGKPSADQAEIDRAIEYLTGELEGNTKYGTECMNLGWMDSAEEYRKIGMAYYLAITALRRMAGEGK
jgi:hypothetical protein